MNSTANKTKRKALVVSLNKHITQGWSRIGERSVVQLPPSKGKNVHIQGGILLDRGAACENARRINKKEENARFLADLFIAALRSNEYKELEASKKIVIVTDNCPAHNHVEDLARQMLTEYGIVNLNTLETLRLGPYSPMLNPIEGCCNSLKAKMKSFVAERKHEMLVRGEYDTFTTPANSNT